MTEKQAKRVVITVLVLAVVCLSAAFYLDYCERTAAKAEMLAALAEAVEIELTEDPTFAERMAFYADAHSSEEIVAAVESHLNSFWSPDWTLSLGYYNYQHYFSERSDYLVSLMRGEIAGYLKLQEFYMTQH